MVLLKRIISKTGGQWRIGLREAPDDEPMSSGMITWLAFSVYKPYYTYKLFVGMFSSAAGSVHSLWGWGIYIYIYVYIYTYTCICICICICICVCACI